MRGTGIKKPIIYFFYLLGRPVFYLVLGIGYLLLVTLTVIKKSLSALITKYKLLITLISKVELPKFKLPPKPKIGFPKPKVILPSIHPKVNPKSRAFITGLVPASLLLFLFYFFIVKALPSPTSISKPLPLTTKIYDRNGQLLYKIYREQNRTKVKLEEIPLSVRQATIATEDKEFYRHPGFSLKSIVRATYYLITEGKTTGASTITQQLVKNLLLSPEKTVERKIKELVLAFLVEQKFTKNQILEMYLNEVGYGGAAYGVEEASQKYFGKSVENLTLAESALLAGLPASPTRYSPYGANPEVAKIRQAYVLNQMVEEKYLTEQESEKAVEQELKFASQKEPIYAPHFVMYVKDLLARKYGETALEQGGLEILTSLDLDIQKKVQKIVQDEIDKLKPLRITNGAALVTNPKTGEILAMVGSKDYFADNIDGNFNVTTALRQPGSSIKPVTYSIALERGFTPATLISDTPITYQVPGQPAYSPKNYDNRFHGNIPLRIALGSSYNVPAVKVLSAFGVIELVKRGQELGITTWDEPSRFGLSLTLGGGEVKMTEMAVVFGTLANLGKKTDLKPILKLKDGSGKILEEENCLQNYLSSKPKNLEDVINNPVSASEISCANQTLNSGVAYLLTNILADNSARTPAFGPNSQLVIPGHEVAVKTGTTTNMRDNWTIGYTPSFLVATWVGNNDNTPMSYVASGVTGASPIWNQIMKELLKDKPNEPFEKPENVITVQICALTGTLSCEGCPSVRSEYFLAGTEPKSHCEPEKVKQILEEKSRQEEEQKKQEKPE